MFKQNNRSIIRNFYFLVLFCFIITITIKINFFLNYFVNIDSAYYIKWFSDLTLADKLLPVGENSFLKNLFLDSNSFLHQLTRRYYNNFSEVYTFVPTLINFLFMNIFGVGFKTFNLGSIIFNSLIPLLCSFYFYGKYDFKNNRGIFIIFFIFFIFITNFYLFYWSPLGIHNYSLIFLLISFFVIDSNYKKRKFLNYKLIIFAIFIPCFSHKFNVPLIFLTLFFVIFLRRNYSRNYKYELFYLIALFLFVILPLLIGFYLNPNNIAFLGSFFLESNSPNTNNQNILYSIFSYELNVIKNSVSKLFSNYYFCLNFAGIILFVISLYKSNNLILKLFLFSNLLIFIFLPLSDFSIRLFNYQLLIVLILIIELFIKIISNYKNKKNLFLLFIFLFFISFSFYKTFLIKKYDRNQNELINFYYKDNQKLKDSLFSIIEINQIEPANIIFGDYLTKDLFYSYFYEYSKNKSIDSFPAISSLYENRNNIKYIKSLNISFEKLNNPYYFILSRIEKSNSEKKNKISKTLLDKYCAIKLSTFKNCGEIKKINLFIDNQPINEIFYTGYNYSLFLYKIENK